MAWLSADENVRPTAEFAKWRSSWFELAEYRGRDVPDVDARIQALIDLWRVPVPGNWQRTIDPQLLGPSYRRGDIDAPHSGEHCIAAGDARRPNR